MKEAFEFVSKLLKQGMDSDFNHVHFCGACIQTTDGMVTMSHPIKRPVDKKIFSVKGLTAAKALEVVDYVPTTFELNNKGNKLVIKKKDINFTSNLTVHTEYTPKKVSMKVSKKTANLPEEFIKFVRAMTKFTIKDSDHHFASSINVINKRIYATNNIAVIRSSKDMKIKMSDCIIPRPLINVLMKVKDNPSGIILDKKNNTVIFLYSSGAFIMCPSIMENAPDLSAVFNDFKKPIPICKNNIEALKRAISMPFDAEIKCTKGTISTDSCSIKNIKDIDDFKVDADNLETLLNIFECVKFGIPFSYFKNESFQAVLAGRA